MEQNNSSVILYTTEDGKTQLDVKLENETVWLSHQSAAARSLPGAQGRGSPHVACHLVALTLMIAESRPDEKDVMVKVVVNLINQNNC